MLMENLISASPPPPLEFFEVGAPDELLDSKMNEDEHVAEDY